MIITKLIGGLGNQMFQYAIGRQIAYTNKTDLKLDISGYENQVGITQRNYTLHVFNIFENFASTNELNKLKRNSFIRKVFKNNSYVKEKHFYFDPRILQIKNNTYLEGYWASEKYFKGIEPIIRQEFTFKYPPDKKNQLVIKKIKNSSSVFIHIRRGDYINDSKTHQYHGICNQNYYQAAIKLITNKIRDPYFFIFSDNPEWVKKEFKLKQLKTVVDHNFNQQDAEDLRLMKLCRHGIIANSSFSWWGAWLNQNPDKIIIAPKKWFNDPKINTKDLIPKSWSRI